MDLGGGAQIRPEIADFAVPIDSVCPHPDNYRHGDLDLIAESLATHGQYRPIIVQASTRYILAGAHTWQAARDGGWDHIAALALDVDDASASKLLTIDNISSDAATNDDVALAELLRDIATLDDLTGTGFDTAGLDSLLASLAPPPDPDAGEDGDPPPSPPHPTTGDADSSTPPAPLQRVTLWMPAPDHSEYRALLDAARDTLGDIPPAETVLRGLRTLAAACDATHSPDLSVTIGDLLASAGAPRT